VRLDLPQQVEPGENPIKQGQLRRATQTALQALGGRHPEPDQPVDGDRRGDAKTGAQAVAMVVGDLEGNLVRPHMGKPPRGYRIRPRGSECATTAGVAYTTATVTGAGGGPRRRRRRAKPTAAGT
jgi:hypothetical protein